MLQQQKDGKRKKEKQREIETRKNMYKNIDMKIPKIFLFNNIRLIFDLANQQVYIQVCCENKLCGKFA